MTFLKIFLAVAFAATVLPAHAQQPDPSQMDTFLDTLADGGCFLTEAQAEVLFANGMEASIAFEFVDGLSVVVDGSCKSIGGLNILQRQFADILALNNCAISEDAAEAFFPANGMEFSVAQDIAKSLIDVGWATVSGDGQILALGPEYCTAAPVMSPEESVEIVVEDTPEGQTPERSLIENFNLLLSIMAAEGCRLDLASYVEVLTAGGLDLETGVSAAMDLIANGFGEIIDNSVLYIYEPQCVPVSGSVEISDEPATEPAFDSTEMGIFMSVMVQNNCILTENMARTQFATAGLAMEQVYILAEEMVRNGQGDYSDDDTTLTITAAECSAATPRPVEDTMPNDQPDNMPIDTDANDPEAQFLAILAGNDCQISQANARDVFAAGNLDFNTGMGIASRMLNDGRATSPDGGQTLNIAPPLCGIAAAGPSNPRDIFIEMLQGNDCSMTAGEFSAALPVDGLDQNTAFGLITELEAEGVIALPPTRDVVTLTAENCR